MGLVDYSDSDSETEAQPSVAAKPAAAPSRLNTKPFQKLVDRANPGKIVVNLPAAAGTDASQPSNDEPPAKRARVTGGNRFSGFGSFLPPPKTTGKPPALPQSSNSASRPAFSFKTGAEPAFSRASVNTADDDGGGVGDDGLGDATEDGGGGSGLKLPPPKSHSSNNSSGPSIPAAQKAAEDVKLVGKPLMFKPLSVSRNTTKKKKKASDAVLGGAATPNATATQSTATAAQPSAAPEPPKKKVSLFSFGDDTPASTNPGPSAPSSGAYEPLFTAQPEPDTALPTYNEDDYSAHNNAASYPTPSTNPSLHSLADNMNLSKAARRELFGRDSNATANSRIVNFDMEREYSHNETLRQSGEQATHNPVRSIAAGKHSLRQLVNAVQSNASALEETFAAQKSKQKEAGARYGWR
jgi:hypothetical protein